MFGFGRSQKSAELEPEPEPEWRIEVEPGYWWGWRAQPRKGDDWPTLGVLTMGGYYGWWRPTKAAAIRRAKLGLKLHLWRIEKSKRDRAREFAVKA
jgi:hypothetical protein